MVIEYLKILAQTCKAFFQDMTKTQVVSVTVKREQRLSETYAVALTCAFQGQNAPLDGEVTMGFVDAGAACLASAAISEHMGQPTCKQLDETSVDVLAEFLNTVMGHTITQWEEAGLVANFLPVKSIWNSSLPTYKSVHCDSYVIILNLSFGWVVFGVCFSDNSQRIQGKKVLVVDDSRLIRGFLSQALEQLGLEVRQASDGLEGTKVHQEFKPDLTIMDLVMPNMGGLEAVMEIRNHAPHAKFIILSSSAKKEERMAAQTLGVSEYLQKPVPVDEFITTVKRVLLS